MHFTTISTILLANAAIIAAMPYPNHFNELNIRTVEGRDTRECLKGCVGLTGHPKTACEAACDKPNRTGSSASRNPKSTVAVPKGVQARPKPQRMPPVPPVPKTPRKTRVIGGAAVKSPLPTILEDSSAQEAPKRSKEAKGKGKVPPPRPKRPTDRDGNGSSSDLLGAGFF
ncbi:hypothetical protein C8J56DRAFT_958337 [Mycena floridula]|nr:hypothetical protein C8J56DRAFT_958337 [Mycena floridula]